MNKKIYIITTVFLLLMEAVFAAPAWELPESGIKLDSVQKQDYIKHKMEDFFAGKSSVKPFTAPDGWSYDKITIENVAVERLENVAMGNERIVLQLHGGGYIGHLSRYYRNLGVIQGVMTSARAVYMVNYKTAPEYRYPYQIEETLKVYKYLLNHGVKNENIYVYGDSSGGNLALALAQKLRSEKIPQPKCYILISPSGTFETTLPSRTKNYERDLVLGVLNKKMYYSLMHPEYVSDKDNLKDPMISPIYANFSGFSPMLIQIGGFETLYDDGILLFKKAAADGAKATITVYPEMPHDFAMLLPELEDSVKSFREIKNFIENLN